MVTSNGAPGLDALQAMRGNLQSTTSALPIRACFRRLSVNVLKIDESLVQKITLGERDSTIVNVMSEVRQQVIAGGVEIRAPLNFQQRSRCDRGKGCYFSRRWLPYESLSCSEPVYRQ